MVKVEGEKALYFLFILLKRGVETFWNQTCEISSSLKVFLIDLECE